MSSGDVAAERKAVKQLRALIQYNAESTLVDAARKADVEHLAQHWASLSGQGKKDFAKEWSTKCGPKGQIRTWVSQNIQQESKSSGGAVHGFATPGQIAEFLDLDKIIKDLVQLEALVAAEIKSNQEKFNVKPEDGVITGANFWLNRYKYKHVKLTDDSHATTSIEELTRSSDIKDGNGAQMLSNGPSNAAGDDDKAEAKASQAEIRRNRRAASLLDGLMKCIQLARTEVLLAKSRKEGNLVKRVKHLEQVELWAVETLAALQTSPCTVDQLELVQNNVQQYKSELQENWLPKPVAKRPADAMGSNPEQAAPAKEAKTTESAAADARENGDA